MVDDDWLEGKVGAGWKEYQLYSTLKGLDMWKRWGVESRCMGIQESLHMHQTQTACYSLRKKINSQEKQQAVVMKDWRGSKLWPL